MAIHNCDTTMEYCDRALSSMEIENPYHFAESAARKKAVLALEKAKELEQKRIQDGYRYIRCEDGVKRLKKVQ